MLIRKIDGDLITLHRDPKTGLAWIENGKTGSEHSAHANIDATGSVRGMKKLGYWRKKDRCIKMRGTIYNIDTLVITDEFDEIAADACHCIACRERELDAI